jgi:hypothetical protein
MDRGEADVDMVSEAAGDGQTVPVAPIIGGRTKTLRRGGLMTP